MATNYLLEFIQNHPNDWEEKLSSDPYNLKISRDGPYVMFKYNQLSSDFSSPIVREARGIIFREDNWKCVRRAFDKFFNYGEPNAAEVDWNTANVQEKLDGCFSGEDSVLMADGSLSKFKHLRRIWNKKPCYVLSYNFETKKIEPKKIINLKRTDAQPEEWLTLRLRAPKTYLSQRIQNTNLMTVTKNHMVFVKRNNDIMEIPAGELKEDDILLTIGYGLTNIQKQVAIGTLLGDGSCTYYQDKYKNLKGIGFCHSDKQKDYVLFKANLIDKLNGHLSCRTVENSFGKSKVRYQTKVSLGFSEIFNKIYKNEKKTLNINAIEEMGWLGFAIWYMDDGNLRKCCKSMSICLHTEGYPEEQVRACAEYFNNIGIKTYVQCVKRRERKKEYYILNFSTEASEYIWKNIREYIPECMQYKLPERHRGFFKEIKDEEKKKMTIYPASIESIEYGMKAKKNQGYEDKHKFDIEVEDNHNYFCNGVLVHNSLISAWFDDKKWHYSTNGTIDVYKAPTGDIKLPTFGDVLEEAFRNNGISKEIFERSVSRLVCYTFELVSPQTRVVIPYEKPDLYFIGYRTMMTEREMNPKESIVSDFFKTPKEYDFHSAQDVIDAAKELPWDEEGYVVVDSGFNRVKIKSPAWLVAHYARSNNSISKESLIQVVLDGDQEEFLVYANDYREELESVEREMEDFIKELNGAAREMKKKYAAEVLKYPKSIQPYLFSKVNNHDASDWVKENMTASKWVKYLEARTNHSNMEELGK